MTKPLTIERVPLSTLHADPANARAHPEKNLRAIAGSLKAFGQVEPLVVQKSTGKVIGGNGRLAVMLANGETEADVVRIDVDDTQATALGIALNRTSETAEWNDETLSKLLDSLPSEIRCEIGFDEADVDELLDSLRDDVKEDETPEPLPDPVSKRGDLWVMGGHRLMCGDSTDGGDVAICLAGEKPFLCVTDPPYGVNYDPQWRSDAAAAGHLAYAARRVGVVTNDDRADWSAAWALCPSDVIYSWHPAGATSLVHAKALQDSGFALRMQIIWAKSNFPIGRGDYHVRHEPCWYAVRDGCPSRRNDDRTQTTLWEINLDKNVEGGHSTQKPVECMAKPIRNHDRCDVYEPFSGSGTTIIAAEQLGRRCYAIEIEPRYVDVAVRRWQKLTGKDATLEGSGATWKETAADRGVEIE